MNASTTVWREVVGIIPKGLGATPTRAHDGTWWVAQPTGLGAPRILRYGLGDATSDMEVFNSAIDIGDGFLANGQYQQAVINYQSAGDTGVSLVGPDIDAMTNSASKALTQQAWEINKNLHSSQISAGAGATAGDAQSAQGFVGQMQNLYAQAAAMQPVGSTVAPSAALVAAAQSLAAYISANGCNGSQDVTKTFQTAYNNEGQILLKVDGKYGAMTAAADQRVLDNGGGGTAPPACHFAGKTTTSTSTKSTTTPSRNWTPWIIGAAVVAGGGIIAVAAHKKKGSRR
jgi:hypothetical protein